MTAVPRPVSILPTGTAFSRYLMILGAARGDSAAAQLMSEHFKDSPTVSATLLIQTKAAVGAGTTTDATWAGPLAVHGIAGEALALERGSSILGTLSGKFRRVPFRTNVPRETGAGSGGAWVAENASIPVASTAYDTVTQQSYKASTIVVMTRELLNIGHSDSERTVRETVTAGVSAFLDGQFLNPAVTLIANQRPASITNGATAITSTGSTAAQMNADLGAMLAAITTEGGGLAWIMRPTTAYRIAATIGGTAAVDVPRSLFGIPMILSKNSPAQITLVDANHVLYSDDGGIDVASSDQATLQMNDAPTDPAVAATVFESLWNRNLWAVRVTRWLAYLRAQTGAVSYMTVSY